jgi:hypothetical protein
MSRHGIAFGLTAERLTKSVIHLGSAIGSEPAMEALAVEKLRGAGLLKHYSGGKRFSRAVAGRPSTARSVAADRVRHHCGGRRDTNGLTFQPTPTAAPIVRQPASLASASFRLFPLRAPEGSSAIRPPSIVRTLTCKARPSSCDRVSVLCKLSNAVPDRLESFDCQGIAQNQRVGACQNQKSRATFSGQALKRGPPTTWKHGKAVTANSRSCAVIVSTFRDLLRMPGGLVPYVLAGHAIQYLSKLAQGK